MELSKETNETEVKVVQNSDVMFKSDVKWVEHVEPQEINEYEKKMLEGTKNVSTLLEEEKEEKPIELTEEQQEKMKRKAFITKVKVIALDKMGKHPLMNPSLMRQKDKQALIVVMDEVIKSMSEQDITLMFNDICNEKLFASNSDYSTYPVYMNYM